MVKKKWTKKKVEEEISQMQIRDKDEITVHGLKPPMKGRPRKSNIETVKTNLDLTMKMIEDLDELVEYMGTTRQAIIKTFILEGLNDFYFAQKVKQEMK